ncbi:MAG: MBL fold metallo-hydrolase, partial [Desulfobacteraceae bacterium]|nr:MBL fold metallo-hydrolase [Desulfobacteraceae bacterium]
MKSAPAQNCLSICLLASGSKGNAIYISTGNTSILLDAGLSGIQIERRMKERGITPESLDAMVVSHEHSDHVTGVGVLARRYNLPIYINPATQKAVSSYLGRIDKFCSFECGSPCRIKDLIIRPFSVSHDAAEPAGFTIEGPAGKIGIATDLGFAPNMVKQHLKDCNLLVLEANHDPEMLEQGPYPWPVKQRIKSRTGHLSNEAARDLLMEVMDKRLGHVILAHISETNNSPEKALSVVA